MFNDRTNTNQQKISTNPPNVIININIPRGITVVTETIFRREITGATETIFRRGITDTIDISLQIEKAGISRKIKEIRNKEMTTHVPIIHDEINCNLLLIN